MSARELFAAWAVPDGALAARGEGVEADLDGWPVRMLDADPAWVGTLAEGLSAQAGRLRAIPVRDVVGALSRVGRDLLDPEADLRRRALEHLGPNSGLSDEMAAAVLDGMALDWTTERLEALLARDLMHPAALDGFVEVSGARVRALGPSLCFQSVSGSVPGVGANAIVRGLLVKAPTWVKPGRGDVVLPVLMARALAEVEPRLADAVAVVYWPGGRRDLEDAVLARAELVVAYGGDEAVSRLRGHTPVTTRFLAYHHRVSLGVVGRDALSEARVHRTASEVAGAVAFFDQRGCVSPHAIYVERGAEVDPGRFARELAGALGTLEHNLPGGVLDAAEASAVHQLRGAAELRARSAAEVEVHHGGAAWWTVILDPEAEFASFCVGRVIRVRPVDDVREVPVLVAEHGRHLQTVGITGCGDGVEELAERLAEVGASRITGFAQVPFPPPWWHHDGQGALAPLVRWIDFED